MGVITLPLVIEDMEIDEPTQGKAWKEKNKEFGGKKTYWAEPLTYNNARLLQGRCLLEKSENNES